MNSTNDNDLNLTNLIVANIKWIAKVQGKTIGIVERSIGVPIGYFSRRSSGTIKNIPIEVVYKVAKYLDVTIDRLCTASLLEDIKYYAEACGYKLVPIEADNHK